MRDAELQPAFQVLQGHLGLVRPKQPVPEGHRHALDDRQPGGRDRREGRQESSGKTTRFEQKHNL